MSTVKEVAEARQLLGQLIQEGWGLSESEVVNLATLIRALSSGNRLAFMGLRNLAAQLGDPPDDADNEEANDDLPDGAGGSDPGPRLAVDDEHAPTEFSP